MQFATAVQLLVSGFALGAVYALVGLGLYITHLPVHKVNFGQGDFVMAAAFLMLTTRGTLGLSLPLAILAVLIAMAALGWMLQRVAILPLEGRRGSVVGSYAWILTTAGVALIVQNGIELVYGKSAQYSPPLFSAERDAVIRVAGINLVAEQLAIIVAAFVVVGLFHRFMFRTSSGQRIQVVAFNPEVAALLGINTRVVKVGVFVIGAVLAAVAGALIGPLVTVHPHMGLVFTIKGLIVAAVGGFGNPVGILLGGLLFGIAESASNYVDSGFGDLYPLVGALAVVAIRPSGLFGERSVDVR